ncbi:MAG: GNAT family N-acetyltransferase [Caulobacteraceae bacterium]
MRLDGDNIYLRFLEVADAEEMLDLQLRNKKFFEKYSCTRNNDYYSLDYQREKIKSDQSLKEKDEKYSFGIFLNKNDKLIGSISLSGILRGPLQSCIIGYTLDKPHNGRGYMSEAVCLLVDFGFKELKLHRIEAGVMPHNLGSIRVLEKNGFHKEGIARKNVEINGKWEDHQVLAIVNEPAD